MTKSGVYFQPYMIVFSVVIVRIIFKIVHYFKP